MVEMRENFEVAGLNYDYIHEKFKDMDEYMNILNFYLDDENFILLKSYLADNDYALAKDATKGLFLLAEELRLFPLYEKLIDIYEDLQMEEYEHILEGYDEMKNVYDQIKGAFCA